MPELQRLRADHASAVLDFELANRAYFAASISDRGDEFYEHFAERHHALLAEQEAGVGAFHVLVAEDGSVLGRFNLLFVDDGSAQLGYRVAQRAAGRGLATATVRELCQLATARYGLRKVRAATSLQNAASQRVLSNAEFFPIGPSDPADLGGKPGTWYERVLADETPAVDPGLRSAGPDRPGPRGGRSVASIAMSSADLTSTDQPVRAEPPVAGTEAETLLGSLDRQRATLAWKCGGLDAAGMTATVGVSTITLGGLLKHLALVEADYFTGRLLGRDIGLPWNAVDWDGDPDWEWRSAADDAPEQLMDLWTDAVVRSRAAVAGVLADGGLDQLARRTWPDGRAPSLRRILVDLIEEYARHVGHADLIRESVDGLTGEDPPD